VIGPLFELMGPLRQFPVVQLSVPLGDLQQFLHNSLRQLTSAGISDKLECVALGVDVIIRLASP